MKPAAEEKVSEKNPGPTLNSMGVWVWSFCGCGFAGGSGAVQGFWGWLCAELSSLNVARLWALWRDGRTGLQPVLLYGFV
jgi:hypothetical protein